MATGMVSTPFPLPPGLDGGSAATAAATDAQTSSGASAVSATPQATCNDTAACNSEASCLRSDRQAIVDEVRRSVLEEVDARVAEKMKDLWARGNKMIKKAEEDSQQKNTTILTELEKCREKQDALMAEHEHLKTLMANMVQQFSMLGGYFGGLAGPKIASPTPCSLAALASMSATNGTTETHANSSSASAASTIQDSPSEFSASGFCAGSFPALPAVPDFPFPQSAAAAPPTPSAATPLSLAEALGSETIPASPSVPVSLMGSLPPPCQGQRIFSFTLRKADGTDLGLNVSHHEDDKALRVEGVRPEGAVEAWNRQCVGSTASEKAVLAGDRIVSVNGVVNDPAKMLEECRDRQLLKLTVIRGEAAATQKTPALRADAPEFVPPASSPAGGLDAISEQSDSPAQDETARRVWKEDAEKPSSTEKPTEC